VEQVDLRAGEGHSSREGDETEEHKAQRIVVEEMKRLGWTKEDLARSKKVMRRNSSQLEMGCREIAHGNMDARVKSIVS
jgi:hypothetical protein